MRPSPRRRPEDSAEGCRALEQADRLRAAAMTHPHMRACLERSADAWRRRATLLDRMEASFNARAAAIAGDQPVSKTLEVRGNG